MNILLNMNEKPEITNWKKPLMLKKIEGKRKGA